VTTGRARILLLAIGLGRGGTERLIVEGLRHLDRDRFDVEVAYLLPWKDALVPEIRALGVPVHCLRSRRVVGLGWVWRLRRLVRAGGFDLVHTHMPAPAAAARLLLARRGPEFVHTEHNMWTRYRLPTRWGNALTLWRNARVVAVSAAVAATVRPPRLLGLLPVPPVEVIIHGVDADSFAHGPEARAEARRRLGLEPAAPALVTVGNLTPKKDQVTMLRAVARLTPAHPSLRLVLIGEGPSLADLKAEVRRLHLDHHVVFAGSRGDVPELLAGFDVFVLSSRFEGLSIALIEGMAAGLPCVATHVGGIPEIITDGDNGLLVPPGKPEALAEAVHGLLADPEKRALMGASGLRHARQHDTAAAAGRMEAIYDEVLDRER
jgi:glycosyltransferase involved in cell wall biosynthesis